ncbi:Uncharacterized protein Fot_20237 [Forsythia ovata]|uniref:Uncharacterized protein n=1 Tax=Forsythia ovata TaxID=205694 RepID=A0ABD1VNC5_9LAMI
MIDEIVCEKYYLSLKPSKLSSKLSVPTDEKDFTEIKSIQGLKTLKQFFWIKGRASVKVLNQIYWYMSCNNCNKISSENYGEIYQCVFSKRVDTKAIPKVVAELSNKLGNQQPNLVVTESATILSCRLSSYSATKLGCRVTRQPGCSAAKYELNTEQPCAELPTQQPKYVVEHLGNRAPWFNLPESRNIKLQQARAFFFTLDNNGFLRKYIHLSITPKYRNQ